MKSFKHRVEEALMHGQTHDFLNVQNFVSIPANF